MEAKTWHKRRVACRKPVLWAGGSWPPNVARRLWPRPSQWLHWCNSQTWILWLTSPFITSNSAVHPLPLTASKHSLTATVELSMPHQKRRWNVACLCHRIHFSQSAEQLRRQFRSVSWEKRQAPTGTSSLKAQVNPDKLVDRVSKTNEHSPLDQREFLSGFNIPIQSGEGWREQPAMCKLTWVSILVM